MSSVPAEIAELQASVEQIANSLKKHHVEKLELVALAEKDPGQEEYCAKRLLLKARSEQKYLRMLEQETQSFIDQIAKAKGELASVKYSGTVIELLNMLENYGKRARDSLLPTFQRHIAEEINMLARAEGTRFIIHIGKFDPSEYRKFLEAFKLEDSLKQMSESSLREIEAATRYLDTAVQKSLNAAPALPVLAFCASSIVLIFSLNLLSLFIFVSAGSAFFQNENRLVKFRMQVNSALKKADLSI